MGLQLGSADPSQKKRKGGSTGTDRQKLSDLVYVNFEAISQQKRMMVTVGWEGGGGGVKCSSG